MKKIFFVLLCLEAVMVAEAQEQAVVRVGRLSRTELLQEAAKLGKMSFEDGKMRVYDLTGDVILETEVTTETVIEVNAEEGEVVIDDEVIEIVNGLDATASRIRLYPVPAVDNLFIEGVAAGEDIVLYSLKGEELLRQKTTAQTNQLSVAALPNGVYLLRVSTNLLKIVKQ